MSVTLCLAMNSLTIIFLLSQYVSNIHLYIYSSKTILVISSVAVEVLCSFAEGNDAAVGYRKTFNNKLTLFCGLQTQERTSSSVLKTVEQPVMIMKMCLK